MSSENDYDSTDEVREFLWSLTVVVINNALQNITTHFCCLSSLVLFVPTQEEMASIDGRVLSRSMMDESDDGTEVVLGDGSNIGAFGQLRYHHTKNGTELRTQGSEKAHCSSPAGRAENSSSFHRRNRRARITSSNSKSSPRTDNATSLKQPLKFKSSVGSDAVNHLCRNEISPGQQRASNSRNHPSKLAIRERNKPIVEPKQLKTEPKMGNFERIRQSFEPQIQSNPWKSITCSSKYGGRLGSKRMTLDPRDLHITAPLKNLGKGAMDEESFAHSLISALFVRDFSPSERSPKWDIAPSVVSRQVSNDGALKFVVKRTACFDSNNVYSLASSSGIIHFKKDKQEIAIEDYSFCNACRRFSFSTG
eukprot:scaffold3621_cov114-Cylindrotheca_fusiformis.AAC.13